MARPYSRDLRERVLAVVERDGESCRVPSRVVLNCLDDVSSVVKVIGSGREVNRCFFGCARRQALPAIDFAHRDLS